MIETSAGILAQLDGVDVDSGTASEIGYGSALNLFICGVRSDFRLSSDNEGTRVNLQVEYFITRPAAMSTPPTNRPSPSWRR